MSLGPPETEVGLGLGSNIGDKAAHIRRAVAELAAAGIVRNPELSPLFRTAPWGPVDQDWFVNACAVGWTALPPLELLARIKALEISMGRTETVRWGPRVIDIDILFYGDLVLDSAALTLPHRDMARRAFVLVPLAAIRPRLTIEGRTVGELAAGLGQTDVIPLEPPSA